MGLYQLVFPKSLHEFKVKVGGGLEIVVQLDCYERWIVHVRLVLGGVKFDDLFREVVVMVDERWLDNHFEDDDFEGFG
jgi:hypothetical protein